MMLSWRSHLGRRMLICPFPGFSSGLSLCALLRLFHARLKLKLKRSQPSTVALILAMIASVLWPACPPAEPR